MMSFSATASSINDAEKISDQINQRLQEQRESQFEIDRESKNKHPAQQEIKLLKPAAPAKSKICHQISVINVEGVTALKPIDIDSIIFPYKNTCLGASEISKLLGSLTNVYISKGYITSRIYLPPQDLSTGTLRLIANEGRISALTEDGNRSSFPIRNTFPTGVGEVLNLRDIEQGLDQVNRLLSNNATMNLIPGEKIGESEIVIKNNTSKRWSANLSLDNQSSKSTGSDQIGLTLGYDNLLNLNDNVSLTYRRTLFPGNRARWQDSNSLSFSYVVPMQYSTLSLGRSNSTYESTLVPPSGDLLRLNGTSDSDYLQIERTVFRSAKDKVKLSLKATIKETETFIAEQFLAVSSRQLSMADAGINWSHNFSNGNITFNFGITEGMSWFSSLRDLINTPSTFPKAQFRRYNLSINSVRFFSWKGGAHQWRTSFRSQMSPQVLYGSEQISIGGVASVRGFRSNVLSSDNGFYLRNDLIFSLPEKLWGGRLQPYIALDTGYVDGNTATPITGSLTGAAIGLKYNRKSLSADLFYSDAIDMPDYFSSEKGQTYFRLSYNF